MFREKVKIPYDKPYIILKGEGKRRTFVEWDDHDNTSQSPTFAAMADNIVVKSMSFRVRMFHLLFLFKPFCFPLLGQINVVLYFYFS